MDLWTTTKLALAKDLTLILNLTYGERLWSSTKFTLEDPLDWEGVTKVKSDGNIVKYRLLLNGNVAV